MTHSHVISASKARVDAGWDDVPHLSPEAKVKMLAATPPHERAARSRGEPGLGAGAIYPVPIEQIEVAPFVIPPYWPRAYGLDVGWKFTAAIWGAQDPSDGTLYLYAEHKRGEAEPVVHAAAIKARGDWMRGAIDPAARNRGQMDGRCLFDEYQTQGLHLVPADNAVEAGILKVWTLLSEGRLKIFRTLGQFKNEYRKYHRKVDEETGRAKIVKKHDHILDASRYLIMTWPRVAKVQGPTRAVVRGHVGPADQIGGY